MARTEGGRRQDALLVHPRLDLLEDRGRLGRAHTTTLLDGGGASVER